MAIDETIYNKPAIRGDISSTTIHTTIALMSIRKALNKIASQTGVDITEEMTSLSASLDKLDVAYDRLTGWKES